MAPSPAAEVDSFPMAPRTAPPAVPDPDDEAADPDHDEAWEAELDRRIADVREGRVQLVPWEEVQAKARAILNASKARTAHR